MNMSPFVYMGSCKLFMLLVFKQSCNLSFEKSGGAE